MSWTATEVFMVLGRRGSGKSYLGERIAEAYPRVVTFDSIHEYDARHGTVCTGFEAFALEIIRLKKSGIKNFRLIVQFDLEKKNNEAEFDECLRVLYYHGGIFIRIEEIQNFSSPHSLPHWLTHCLTTGRHRSIGLLFLTQMPRYCNKALISQASHLFCGQMHENNDIEYARTVLGDRAYELQNIEPRKFLYFSPGKPITLVNNSLA